MKYAPKEVARHLPKAALITVHWRWWWFRRIRSYSYFNKLRIANALIVWIGPLEITVRRPYLIGPARQLHPEAFIRARQEGWNG